MGIYVKYNLVCIRNKVCNGFSLLCVEELIVSSIHAVFLVVMKNIESLLKKYLKMTLANDF